MFKHTIRKDKFEALKYDYKLKQEKDQFGDYYTTFKGMSWEEQKLTKLYNEEKQQAIREHFKQYSEFDISNEALQDLLKRKKAVFDKYFTITGDFMLTITFKPTN